MILRVSVPEGWTSTAVADGILHEHDSTSVRALRIRERPADAAHWMQRTALQGAPTGTAWTQRSKVELKTVDGWPAWLFEVDLEHATFKRTRVVVLYQFLDYAAGAIVNADPATYVEQRPLLLDMLGSARPDWGPQDMTCLTRMFGDAASHIVTLK